MNWRLWTWKEIIACVLGAAGLAGFCLYALPYMPRFGNFGFGPEWGCTPMPKGEPVCVKKPVKPTGSP